ncbi:MAG: sigma-70 family RNA polymerase sigma factor [Alphaproteobacteria bacterium]
MRDERPEATESTAAAPAGGALPDARALEALVAAIAAGRDRAAFARLFDHLMPRLKAYAMRLGADGPTAEEVAQEVMLLVWRKAGTFDPARASVTTWVFTIARNKRIDFLRRSRRPELDPADPALVPDPPAAPDEAVGRRGAEQRLRQAIGALPREQSDLLMMAFFEDRSHRDIAAATRLPLGTVKSRIRLALERLRRGMEDVAA